MYDKAIKLDPEESDHYDRKGYKYYYSLGTSL